MTLAMTTDAHAQSAATESTLDDLATQRYLLDLALQPLDAWEGFVRIDQILSSALRYQLCALGYALSMYQHTRTPAFTGYLAEAQRNAILKMCDKKVWGYWAWQSLIGYQRWNPDPIAYGNVMYSGYFGAQIGMYEALNADRRFSEPGGLTLTWNRKKKYEYDFGTLNDAIVWNMHRDPEEPQYNCEPYLVYPLCNAFAMNSVRLHDRLHGGNRSADRIARIRDSYDRNGWRKPNGRFVSARRERSSRDLMRPGLSNDTFMAYLLSPLMRDIAENTYQGARDHCLTLEDGRVNLPSSRGNRLDPGNYRTGKSAIFTHAVSLLAARELGDDEMARALQRTIDEENAIVRQGGARSYDGASTLSNALCALARFLRPGALGDLVDRATPAELSGGPILAQAAYPEVLVAKATNDAETLDLVLRPGEGPCRTRIAIGCLKPGGQYRAEGAVTKVFDADARGRALIEIDLPSRLEVRVGPRA